MQIGASLPVGDIGTGPGVIRDFAQAVEGLGFDFLAAPDHVLGGDPAAVLPGGRRMGTTATAYHDPFVLFGFLAGVTRRLGFVSAVLILAQRQAALVAKQAASLDALCEGRFRLGIGVGWNEIEFQGLGVDFHQRGRIAEEQVPFMQALWAEPHVTFKGRFHALEGGGINPRPASGRVPVWFGGHAEATFRRAARFGDGFIPNAYPPGEAGAAAIARLRRMTAEAGRDPSRMGIDVWVSPGQGTPEDWRAEVAFWKAQGVSHITAHTTFASAIHRRIAGTTAEAHLAALRRYREAVADLLG